MQPVQFTGNRCAQVQGLHFALVFFKRLSDISDNEFAFHVKEYEDEELAGSIIEADLAHSLKTSFITSGRHYSLTRSG